DDIFEMISVVVTVTGDRSWTRSAREFRAWLVPIAISGRRFPPPAPEPGEHPLPRPTSRRRLGQPRPRSVPFLSNSWSGRVGDRTALYGSPPCAFLPAAPLAERRNAQG